MLKRNQRLVVFTVTVLGLLVTLTFLPASAQLSQWRSLNPRRDGTVAPGGLGPILYSVHLINPTSGWAVGGTCDIYTLGADCPGDGFVLYWDGVKWRHVLTPPGIGTLASVFAASANDVWAVGAGPTAIHWDGTSWVSVSAAVTALGVTNLLSVFILPGGTDGWAVGDGGTTDNIRWSGTWPTGAWSAGPVPNLEPVNVLRSVSLSSSTFGWIVGSGGEIFRWDGLGWNDMTLTSPVPGIDMLSVFAISGSDAWSVGVGDTIIRWNGASWTGPMVAPTAGVAYRSIRMVSAADGWIAGSVDLTSNEGTLLRWNGVAWTIVRSWVTVDLNGLFMLSGGTVGSAVGDAETIIYWNGIEWNAQTSPTSTDLFDVYLTASNDGWGVGAEGNIFRWNGQSWHHYETLPSGANLYGLFMRTSSDAWAVGAPVPPTFPPTILRWNGISWTVVSPPGVAVGETLFDVYMLSATEGWAVGSGGTPITMPDGTGRAATILKWDGAIWTSVPSGTAAYDDLYSVHMLSSNEGWAVGTSGDGAVIVRWNGLAWSPVTPPLGIGGLRSVHFLNPNDGWAVGDRVGTMPDGTGGQATIIHWDGTQWRRVPGPAVDPGGFLSKVYMVSSTDGWAVGQKGTGGLSLIVHWDGLTWNVVATLPVPPTMSVALQSVFMVGSLDGWIVSDDGLILKYGPEVVPGTTTSTSTTTVTETSTSTLTSVTTTSTTTPPPEWRIPGFPIESILAGLVAGIIALTMIRRRRNVRS